MKSLLANCRRSSTSSVADRLAMMSWSEVSLKTNKLNHFAKNVFTSLLLQNETKTRKRLQSNFIFHPHLQPGAIRCAYVLIFFFSLSCFVSFFNLHFSLSHFSEEIIAKYFPRGGNQNIYPTCCSFEDGGGWFMCAHAMLADFHLQLFRYFSAFWSTSEVCCTSISLLLFSLGGDIWLLLYIIIIIHILSNNIKE